MTPRPRQGAVLLVGAAGFYALLGPAAIGFHWTPLVIGLVYLAAALVGGRRGSYWATAVVLTVFGLGPVAIFEVGIDATQAATYTVCLGLGVLVAAQFAARGWAIGATAVGAVILGLGVVYALQPHVGLVEEPAVYGVALAAVGAARLAGVGGAPEAGGARRRRVGDPVAERAPRRSSSHRPQGGGYRRGHARCHAHRPGRPGAQARPRHLGADRRRCPRRRA